MFFFVLLFKVISSRLFNVYSFLIKIKIEEIVVRAEENKIWKNQAFNKVVRIEYGSIL